MKLILGFTLLSSLTLAACGGSSDDGAENTSPSTEDGDGKTFDPPAPGEGYERIVAPVMTDLEPGSDISYCQYVRGPSDRDLDVLDMTGFQSRAGHHAVAYATTVAAPVGQSGPCKEEDNLSGGFLGGVGGEAGGGASLPEGVAFRLPMGSSIMLNTHFLNTSDEVIDGESVIDVKFAEVDPSRKIASMFANGNFSFDVPAGSTHSAVAECVVPRDMEIILFANHMHDHGSRVMTDLVRADTGAPELIHEDPAWTYEMQFKAVYRRWDIDSPLQIKAGDTLRTHCNWDNATTDSLTFPREMCFGVSFFLSDGSTSPVCIDGAWLEDAPGVGG